MRLKGFRSDSDPSTKRTPYAIYSGNGTPEGVITAVPGDIYVDRLETDGKLWVKNTGTANTGWVQVSASSQVSRQDETFLGDNSETDFPLATIDLVTNGIIDVYVNGLLYREGASQDYTLDIANDVVIFNTPPASGAEILVRKWAGTSGGGAPAEEYIEATGGTVTTVGDYKVHTFNASGTFEVTNAPAGRSLEVVVIAGGGGGGMLGGGGGAGGVLYNSSFSPSVQSYTVTIGAGGTPSTRTPGTFNFVVGSNGSDSSFGALIATGGGLGGSHQQSNGASGGSGGGGQSSGSASSGGAGTSGQGNSGGNATGAAPNYGGGGGGGYSTAGAEGGSAGGGNGGAGFTTSLRGSSETFAAGGGGGTQGGVSTRGIGGHSSAGNGGYNSSGQSTGGDALANSGSGGGGGGYMPGELWNGGVGGSGIVILKYLTAGSTPPAEQYIEATGGTITQVGSKKVHSFTSSGNFVVSAVPAGKTIDYIIVGGGGGGGGSSAGGGGGGGVIQGTSVTPSIQTYPITIGAGGNFGAISAAGYGFPDQDATAGGDSTGFGQTALGGGKGGTYAYNSGNGGAGASGGGGGYSGTKGLGTSPQGNNGGDGGATNYAGGGGGFSSAGVNYNAGTSKSGNGGAGFVTSMRGTSEEFACGGGGGTAFKPSQKGLGGGTFNGISPNSGHGWVDESVPGTESNERSSLRAIGTSGAPNSGHGGGGAGGYWTNGYGGTGGSGIVIISYDSPA